MPLSTIFQSYHDDKLYWWWKLEKTTDLLQVSEQFEGKDYDNGALRHFQQYFSNIGVVSFINGGKRNTKEKS
jgi:hypothetical protein